MSNRSSESSTYDIRLCHIIKWNDFDGYGFNLHAEKGKPGQYIGKVDEGSPAEAAGLKEGDRIVEVNGVNISNENHKQVVQRIKTTANEAKLLVVDPEADNYFRSNNIVVKSSLPNVRILKTPSKKQTNILLTNGDEGDDAHSQISGKSMENESNCGNVRLCHIIKWDDFDGYGFNLHAEKGRSGQYVGKVDEGSPAEAAGLKEGDRILEVNDVNIVNENHKQVVQMIKSMPNETKLLVVDEETEIYYKSKNIPVNSSLPNVTYIKTPNFKRITNGAVSSDDSYSRNSTRSETYQDENEFVEKISLKDSASTTSSSGRKISIGSDFEPPTPSQHDSNGILDKQIVVNKSASSTKAADDLLSEPDHPQEEFVAAKNKCESSDGGGNGSKLDLNMTAKELRAKLAMKKKYDPKKDSLDFKKKYEIVQKL